MSIISSRKSIGSSILKSSTPNRDDSIKKIKQLRFEIQEVSSVKEILQQLDDGLSTKAYEELNYRIAHGLSVKIIIISQYHVFFKNLIFFRMKI
jgi:hypothetical protein